MLEAAEVHTTQQIVQGHHTILAPQRKVWYCASVSPGIFAQGNLRIRETTIICASFVISANTTR